MSDTSPKGEKVLRIWAVTDSKPGHQNQTEGLIQSLANYRNVTVEWMPCVSFAKNVWVSITKKRRNSNDQLPDLLIGTGHQTHITLLALKWRFGGRVVIMMSPSLPMHLFDLCFIPRHDKPHKADNVIETFGPINRVIPSSSSFSKHTQARIPSTGLILMGGPSRHFLWDSVFVAKSIESLVTQNQDTEWLIAGSRRTPPECYEALKQYSPDTKIVFPEEVSSDWLPEKIQESDQIWVTEDSMSMVYESLTSGAQTGIIRLAYNKATRVTKEIDCLISEGRLHTTSINSMIQYTHEDSSTLYEADRCAKLLLQKFDL